MKLKTANPGRSIWRFPCVGQQENCQMDPYLFKPQIYKKKINTFFEPKKERIKEINEIMKSPFFYFLKNKIKYINI
jgi:hypothetical protein